MLAVIPLLALLAGGTVDTSVVGTVRDARSSAPIVNAEVAIAALGRRARTDSVGVYALQDVPAGRWRVQAMAVGYAPFEVLVRVPVQGAVRIDIALEPRVVSLQPVEVHDQPDASVERREARALFDREVLPGVSFLSGREIRALPTIVEPDVVRALQALPGVTPPNEFDAQLYMHGGAPDQSLFLLDGARVFGPHHLFGMSGVFNADAVDRVELFRGIIPARFGSALSAVVDVGQGDGSDSSRFEGGLSMLGVRGRLRGQIPGTAGSWMLAARRTHVDMAIGGEMPYAFHDLQGGFSLGRSRHRIIGSTLVTGDRFRMFFGNSDGTLESSWRNAVGSLGWTWGGPGGWSTSSVLWGSTYRASLSAGEVGALTPTTNRVGAGGLRFDVARATPASTVRIGLDMDAGTVALRGTEEQGSYFQGAIEREYVVPALYAEAERHFGKLRLSPGLRVTYDAGSSELHAEPRIGARLTITDRTALTLGLARAHQRVSMLRDERTVLPGPPFWFVHPEGAPTSRTDGASLEVDHWLAGGWALRSGLFARRFSDTPHWRPVAVRDDASVSYDDGSAVGAELQLRRYGDRASGWVSYTASRVRFTDAASGAGYDAPWDRRHSVNAAVMLRPMRRLQLSARTDFGTGHPFWPFTGNTRLPIFDPIRGRIQTDRLAPLWADQQLRMPQYLRVDAGLRTEFTIGRAGFEPYLHLQNIGRRPNVLNYRVIPREEPRRVPTLVPQTMPGFVLPTLGVNVRF